MGQCMGRFWGRVQGKPHIRKICDKVFDQCMDQTQTQELKVSDLHLAILLAYNAINKHFPGPHKEPPPPVEVRAMVELFRQQEKEKVTNEEFYEMILKWVTKDLRKFAMSKLLLSLLAAPAMAELTKRGARKLPRVSGFVDKVPTSVFASAYIFSLVVLQDFTVMVD